MPITGTYDWTMDVDSMIRTAFERIGGQDLTGLDTAEARQALNLIQADLQTRGTNLFALERGYFVARPGINVYYLPERVYDLKQVIQRTRGGVERNLAAPANPIATTLNSNLVTLNVPGHGAQVGEEVRIIGSAAVGGVTLSGTYEIVSFRPNSFTVRAATVATSTATGGGTGVSLRFPGYIDLMMSRIARNEYNAYPQKSIPARPYTWYLEKAIQPALYVFPSPNTEYIQLVWWGKRKISDIVSMIDNMEMPTYFLPAMVAGLAYFMGQRRPGLVDAQRRMELKAEYDELLMRATDEDRDEAPLSFLPDISVYYR